MLPSSSIFSTALLPSPGLFVLGLALPGLLVPQAVNAAIDYAKARKELVQLIEQDVRDTEIYIGTNSLQPRVMQAIGRVARHAFVPRYGVKRLDDQAQARWRSWGYQVHPIDMRTTIPYGGAVRCLTNVLRRPRTEAAAAPDA